MPVLLALLLLVTVGVSSARAQTPYVNQSIEIADQWLARYAPSATNHCVGARTQVSFFDSYRTPKPTDDDAPREGIEAYGWANAWVAAPDPSGTYAYIWVWDSTRRCDIGVKRGLTPEHECEVVWHEKVHLALGPKHHSALVGRSPWPCRYVVPVRVRVREAIRELLPRPRAPWQTRCGRTALRMRCIARRDRFTPRHFDVRLSPSLRYWVSIWPYERRFTRARARV